MFSRAFTDQKSGYPEDETKACILGWIVAGVEYMRMTYRQQAGRARFREPCARGWTTKQLAIEPAISNLSFHEVAVNAHSSYVSSRVSLIFPLAGPFVYDVTAMR